MIMADNLYHHSLSFLLLQAAIGQKAQTSADQQRLDGAKSNMIDVALNGLICSLCVHHLWQDRGRQHLVTVLAIAAVVLWLLLLLLGFWVSYTGRLQCNQPGMVLP